MLFTVIIKYQQDYRAWTWRMNFIFIFARFIILFVLRFCTYAWISVAPVCSGVRFANTFECWWLPPPWFRSWSWGTHTNLNVDMNVWERAFPYVPLPLCSSFSVVPRPPPRLPSCFWVLFPFGSTGDILQCSSRIFSWFVTRQMANGSPDHCPSRATQVVVALCVCVCVAAEMRQALTYICVWIA